MHVTARLVPRVDMERDLIDAELDFAIAYISDDNDQIVAERLFDEELVLVVGSKHSHAGRKSMPMRELATLPLVLLTPEFGARQFVDRFFAETGLQSHVVLEMNAIEPIMATIRNSRLASVLSAGAIVDASGLHIVRLTEPAPKRSVGILWRRNGHRTAAALRMAEMIQDAYSETVGIARKPAKLRRRHAARGKIFQARTIDRIYLFNNKNILALFKQAFLRFSETLAGRRQEASLQWERPCPNLRRIRRACRCCWLPDFSAAARPRSSIGCSRRALSPTAAVVVNEYGEVSIDHVLVTAPRN